MQRHWPTRRSSGAALAALAALLLLHTACSSSTEDSPRAPGLERGAATTTTSVEVDLEDAPRLVAAGDIACAPGVEKTPGQCRMDDTAALVESLDADVVAPLGDLQYERGEAKNFAESYDATWGRFKSITRPAPGNHEYAGGKAPGYFSAFGGAADGVDGRGWYSYELGSWHVVVLNSVCTAVGGCGEGSAQHAWLLKDLADSQAACTLAYWHHPRYSSGLHGSDAGYDAFWRALAADGADVVLGGHDHHYERFKPLDGVRQFVVGTGGRSLYPAFGRETGSEFVDDKTFGVLELTLRSSGYDWRFIPVGTANGAEPLDRGSAPC